MKAALNNTMLKNLPEGRDMDIYDTKLIGFVLRLRKSGRHSWRVNYARGKWHTLGRLTDLKPAEAREQAKAILGDAAKGKDVRAESRRAKSATFRDYLKNIYGPWAKAHRKDGAATLARLQACFDSEIGGKRLPEITHWIVEKWRSKRLKDGKAHSTVNRDVTALKSALNRAVEWNVIDANPIAKVKPAKLDRRGVVRYLSDDEETRLRAALAAREEQARAERANANQWRLLRGYPIMPDLRAVPYVDHLRPLVLLAMNTGLRRGELFNLKWSDVDLIRSILTVHGYGAKSGQTRHIPLNTEALAVLQGWQKTTEASKGLVFPGRDGGRLDNINKSWRGVLSDAGITGFRFHDLRHHFASKLVMAGVDLNTVRELLGHGDLMMTLRYAHLAPEHKAEAVARLTAAKESRKESVA
ncbi:MAG: site-specific integrase [Nitrococcus mobilis]|nr:site-specific integrase [Nitrococcus mobilis]